MAHQITWRLRPHLEGIAALAGKMRNRRDADLQDFRQIEEVNGQILRVTEALESFTEEAPDPSERAPVDLKRVVRQAVSVVSQR